MNFKTFPKGQVDYDYNKLKEILNSAFFLENGDIDLWHKLFPFSSLDQPIRKQIYIDAMHKFIQLPTPFKIDVFLVSNKKVNEIEVTLEKEDNPYEKTIFEDIIKKIDSAHYYLFHIKEERIVIIVQKTKSGDLSYSLYVYPLFKTRKLEETEKDRILSLIKKEVGKNDLIRYRVNPFDRVYQDKIVDKVISIFDLANNFIYLPRGINYQSLDLDVHADSLPLKEELDKFKKVFGNYNRDFYLIKYLDSVEEVYHIKSEQLISIQEIAKLFDKRYGTLENLGFYFPKNDMLLFIEEYNYQDYIFSLDCSRKIEE